jgi:hypothetical protein
MSQALVPLNGGIKDIVIRSSAPGIFLSKQYISQFGLNPRPSEWLTTGRPIYDRLPSASQNYKKVYEEGDYEAFVYIPYGESELGRSSLSVVSSGEDNEFLVIQSGSVVWKNGTIPVNPTIINLEELGMWNTKYLLAYRMYFDNSPRVFQYEVEGFSLVGQDLAVNSSTDGLSGWRYTSDFAFTGLESRPWSNLDSEFPGSNGPAFLEWQTPYPNSLSRITLKCPPGFEPKGVATLKRMVCQTQAEEGSYCYDYTWEFEASAEPKFDDRIAHYEFLIQEPTPQTGWRVDWDEEDLKIYQISVDGILSLKRKPEEGISVCELVAFPENAVPAEVDLGEGGSVRATYCNLALVDVNKDFKVEKISDLRQIVKVDYTPISDWLTQPWDGNLSDLFKKFSNFTELWMSPVSAMKSEYEGLNEKSIQVV